MASPTRALNLIAIVYQKYFSIYGSRHGRDNQYPEAQFTLVP
jgi:hypothetical protein